MTSARIPCKTIDRYPVVARWRSDVDFCAAGIYCFQPYCMTGELDPPANPLICPQFCVRFNDLDNIGITGRHYSGFIMLGIQVFNKKDNFIFFKEEVVEFNYRWLTEFLKVDPEEITFIEDVWCGGGNLGPCVEYFVGGLEVGNMVFIEYKTFHDGSREKLEVQVVDVGIGLERISWFINGTPTSYNDTFKNALEAIQKRVKVEFKDEIWEKFGPYSSLLNTDEVDDIEKTWEKVAAFVGESPEIVKKAIAPIKDLYVILDHTRTLFVTIYDGSLPSNVGGGGNIRNIFRRVLAILHKNNWWNDVKLEGLLEIIEAHKRDLELIYGEGHFKPSESIAKVLSQEILKWETTDKAQKDTLKKLVDKRKGQLNIDDWIIAMQSWGIPADKISEISGLAIPGNLYYEIARRQEIQIQATEISLYDTNHLAATECLYFIDNKLSEFEGQVIDVYQNFGKENLGAYNIVILNQSAFYPTSGGQQHDTGILIIDGVEYNVINAEKVGNCTLHFLDKELHNRDIKGLTVKGTVDMKRRKQLMSHHTGTHIVFAACRKILGPHVWQNGAKKTIEKAHLDITHFQSLTFEEELAIENEANRIIMDSLSITKSFMNKKEAELNYGFTLYQGGVVPGNNLRIVKIENTDVEACCGTHCDNTAEVGWVKLLKSSRISDGIVRLEYVCFEKALQELNEETHIINNLCQEWGIERSAIVKTATRFFTDYKKFANKIQKQDDQIFNLQLKLVESRPEQLFYNVSTQDTIGFYIANFNEVQAKSLKDKSKGIFFLNKNYLFGLVGNDTLFTESDLNQLVSELKEINAKKNDSSIKEPKLKVNKSIGKKKDIVDKILNFTLIYELSTEKVIAFLKQKGAIEF